MVSERAQLPYVLIRPQKPPGQHGGKVLRHVVEMRDESVMVLEHPPLGPQHAPDSGGQSLLEGGAGSSSASTSLQSHSVRKSSMAS
ncbi:hypothetical protein E2C01_025451 [Portunus trituberculatus]|uniref:Uncharacterized protein n=1 Tax=Portunus trituberculatus TaxID=210409 RepID=A0A5B7EFM8_PORTR|nr:hypothetical protein [Portunus trituberculatus]